MNLPDLPLMTMLRERMDWLSQRQNLLSQNVANADTPGYAAHDLKPLDFGDILGGETAPMKPAATMVVTDPRHIAITPPNPENFEDVETHDAEGTPNGNAVGLEQEMIKVADTQAQFQAATNLYAKALSMMKTAIGH
jgi:flagellar basal-body rod protein FlgB